MAPEVVTHEGKRKSPDESLNVSESETKDDRRERKRRRKEERRALKESEFSSREMALPATADVKTPTVGGNSEERDAARRARRKAEKKAKKAASTQSLSKPDDGPKANAVEAQGDSDDTHTAAQIDIADGGNNNSTNGHLEPHQSEVDDFLAANRITIEDPLSHPLRAMLSFSHVPTENLSAGGTLQGFKAPTPIQSAAWPYAFASRDMIGVAETGSGKTLAFGMPLAKHIVNRVKSDSQAKKLKYQPIALVVSPTRELAVQIHEQLVKLGENNHFNATCVYGGVAKDSQASALRKAQCVVATPGRLRDFMDNPHGDSLNLGKVDYVVLDEADRMLDKGFEEDIKAILGACAKKRQTLMFTATWPVSVREIAKTFMQNPVKVTIGDRDELRANERIKQIVHVVDGADKNTWMLKLLKEHTRGNKRNDRMLVFCLYKKEAAYIERLIARNGFTVGGIHGDMSQQRRTESLEAFKNGSIPVLVATDVAARGLDIPAVKVVLNVTFPLTVEDYVHRIGRTGRAGQDGIAVTLFTSNEKPLAGGLMNVLRAAQQEVPEDLAKFGNTVKKKEHGMYGRFVKEGLEGQTATKITFD